MKYKKKLSSIILFTISLLIWIPLWMMVTGSFMGISEITECVGPALTDKKGYASWHLIPNFLSLKSYVKLLLDSPGFFAMFWNSVIQVIPGLIGQLIIAVPAAWSFARFEFRGKRVLFIIYIILMMMPFQVTMISTYLVLDKFHMLNKHWALIIPNIFATLPVFIMEKFFKSIPNPLIEASKIDGADEFETFLYIGIPLGVPGIISVFVLGFLESWNAIEQPLTFIKDKSLWPLSLYLPTIAIEEIGVAMVASIIALLPALLIFLAGQKYFEQGIVASGIKE